MDDLYVRLQKALDEAEVDVKDMGHVWRFGDQLCGDAALRLISLHRRQLAEFTGQLADDEDDETAKWHVDQLAEFWLTDTETTDGRKGPSDDG